jgi:adenylosuccinate synthase
MDHFACSQAHMRQQHNYGALTQSQRRCGITDLDHALYFVW